MQVRFANIKCTFVGKIINCRQICIWMGLHKQENTVVLHMFRDSLSLQMNRKGGHFGEKNKVYSADHEYGVRIVLHRYDQ